jgi:hypothetical protein
MPYIKKYQLKRLINSEKLEMGEVIHRLGLIWHYCEIGDISEAIDIAEDLIPWLDYYDIPKMNYSVHKRIYKAINHEKRNAHDI